MNKLKTLLTILALTFPATAVAGVFYNNPGGFSDHPRDAMANAWLVRVKPGENARFYWNVVQPGCPALMTACRRPDYLVPGDIAVAAYATGAFTVVEFVGPKGTETDGAIESRLLERMEAPIPSPQDWIGHWQYGNEQRITVTGTANPSVLAFQGDATWGAGDPERVKRGAVHIGDLAAYVKPIAQWGGFTEELGGEGEAGFQFPSINMQKGLNTDWTHYFPAQADNSDGSCRASFRLLGPYLIAYTPLYVCGGMNVTFTGVYRRVETQHKRRS